MIVGIDEIVQITDYIWSTALNFDLEPVLGQSVDKQWMDTNPERDMLWSWVGIHGAWEGRVLLGCRRELVQKAARVMYERPTGQLTKEELWDAVGELANMIGGNIKSLLPGPSELSLPTVACRAPDVQGHTIGQAFRSQGYGFCVTLIKESPMN